MANSSDSRTVSSGLSFGAALAITISWSVNHSIWWCIGHGICGWLYVIFYACGWTDS